MRSSSSRGRVKPEPDCKIRSVYERDTGRIIYSQAFRRLKHKTQVFFNPENDHICSRLEHVMYVDYIAQTIGRALNLNTDLIRAIALGHDVGHTPFGHSGERILDKMLKETDPKLYFEHESNSLRVLDVLEQHGDTRDDERAEQCTLQGAVASVHPLAPLASYVLHERHADIITRRYWGNSRRCGFVRGWRGGAAW